MVSAPEFVPEAGVTVSHVWLLEAVHGIATAPVLETETLCEDGLEPLTMLLKESVAADVESDAGAGGATVRVTATTFGEPVAPVEATTMAPLYVPAARPLRFVAMESVPELAPDAGETVSQV